MFKKKKKESKIEMREKIEKLKPNKELKDKILTLLNQYSEEDFLNTTFDLLSNDATETYLYYMDICIRVNYPNSSQLFNDLSLFLLKKELLGETICPKCGETNLKVLKRDEEFGRNQQEYYWVCSSCGHSFGIEEVKDHNIFEVEDWRNESCVQNFPIK